MNWFKYSGFIVNTNVPDRSNERERERATALRRKACTAQLILGCKKNKREGKRRILAGTVKCEITKTLNQSTVRITELYNGSGSCNQEEEQERGKESQQKGRERVIPETLTSKQGRGTKQLPANPDQK